jgi:hypothetical protein
MDLRRWGSTLSPHRQRASRRLLQRPDRFLGEVRGAPKDERDLSGRKRQLSRHCLGALGEE